MHSSAVLTGNTLTFLLPGATRLRSLGPVWSAHGVPVGASATPRQRSHSHAAFILAVKSERGWEPWRAEAWGGVAMALSHRARPGATCWQETVPGRHTLSSVGSPGHG